ncbi:MAG: phospholipase D-like domain-containing protein [Kosmotogaceae bacterium]
MGPFFVLLIVILLILSVSLYSTEIRFTKDNAVLDSLLEIIESTEDELFIVAFSLDHPEIIESLNNLVEKGVHVEVIVDDSTVQRTILLNPEFDVLCDSSDALIHAKFIVSDKKNSVIGTGNFTLSGLEEGLNSFIFFDSSEIAEGLSDFFLALKNGNRATEFDNSNCAFYLLPSSDFKDKVLDRMIKAKKSIFIAAYAFTDYDILSVMKLQSIKGIEIRCLVDSWTYDYGEIVSYLSNPFNVRRIGRDKSLHEKTMVLDREVVITGSANLTYSAYEKNRELVVIIRNKEVAKKFLEYFVYIWEVWGNDH